MQAWIFPLKETESDDKKAKWLLRAFSEREAEFTSTLHSLRKKSWNMSSASHPFILLEILLIKCCYHIKAVIRKQGIDQVTKSVHHRINKIERKESKRYWETLLGKNGLGSERELGSWLYTS